MPQVIEAGRVYAAVPPLFGMENRGKMTYFTDMQGLAKYSQSLFTKKYHLTDMKDRPISQKECVKIFYKNMDYARDMNILARILAVNPYLLETVLFEIARAIDFNVESHIAASMAQKRVNQIVGREDSGDSNVKLLIDGSINKAISYSLLNLDYKKFKNLMEKKYRFIKVHMKDGTIVVEGLFESKYQYIFINDHTIKTSIHMIRQIASNEILNFKMNGEPTTLYGVMTALDSVLPADIKRYKGLGEQNEDELKDSTMSPVNRTLIRYTLESAKEEIESIRYIDSNKSALLNGITVTRQDIE